MLRSTPAMTKGAISEVDLLRARAEAARRLAAAESLRLEPSRIGSDDWTCTTYDARGRVLTKSYPANTSAPARTVTYNYSVGGNPLVTGITDSAGTITSTADQKRAART